MVHAYRPAIRNEDGVPLPMCEDDTGFDADVDNQMVSLLEENARLRALVVQLSDLVLKKVLEGK
ncbi:hypothetical protein [Bradyrhizobium sp. NP1]|jgi:hypothetical protein|uniref:hypothetical protein n=1 Tax=Bradyrhizobium sp. NP1 TaxID=3049772 RepID=UPI0025A5EC10|nr:hypothetical protein [Bradyrhizobium sp. NP1]WJR79384.1 hypothetical protein QOU61_06295 [Bradyrhizobium sp. NP1]